MARILPFYIPLAILVFALPATVCCSQETDETPKSLNDPLTEEEKAITTDTYVPPDQMVRKAFEAPPNAKQLSSRLVWIDREKQRVYADGFVTMRDGPLEMFACPVGTKEHEAIVATISKSSELHTALLAIGAQPGTPVSYLPNFVPATGQRIRVWICYYDKDGQFKAVDARRWVQKNGTDKQMDSDWVFAGSGFWKDPSNGREYYRADSGDMICVSNFSTAMLDIPVASSADANNLLYIPFTKRIPERGTPVRLVFVPIPIPNDQPETASKVDASKPPTKVILPKKK
ncbi:MAG: YdjY domain-containing protein [Rubripirellula sp.]